MRQRAPKKNALRQYLDAPMATKEDVKLTKQELLAHILVVDERVTAVQHGMVRVHDYLNLEKRVAMLEQRLEQLQQKQ